MIVDSRFELALLGINTSFEDAEVKKVHSTTIAFTFIPIPLPMPFPICRSIMRRLRRSSSASAAYCGILRLRGAIEGVEGSRVMDFPASTTGTTSTNTILQRYHLGTGVVIPTTWPFW